MSFLLFIKPFPLYFCPSFLPQEEPIEMSTWTLEVLTPNSSITSNFSSDGISLKFRIRHVYVIMLEHGMDSIFHAFLYATGKKLTALWVLSSDVLVNTARFSRKS